MNFLITGGTGFIGGHFIKSLLQTSNNILILTRNKSKVSLPIKAIRSFDEIDKDVKIDVIINLAGHSINNRWTKSCKRELIDSRLKTTKNIINFVKDLNEKPKILINASAIGYYGKQDGNNILNENSSFNNSFTHKLCKMWEDESKKIVQYNVRLCIARLGVVLGNGGGALKQMILPFKMGLGGKLGNGNQAFSWVHINDVVKVFHFFINNKNQHGIYNVVAPNAITNAEFVRELGVLLKRPTIFNMPSCVVKVLFGEMGEELLLNGQNVVPQKLIDSNFKFDYPELKIALKEILKQ